jgi:hypothetical protein
MHISRDAKHKQTCVGNFKNVIARLSQTTDVYGPQLAHNIPKESTATDGGRWADIYEYQPVLSGIIQRVDSLSILASESDCRLLI